MALSDWSSFGAAGENHSLDEYDPGTGQTSLMVSNSRTTSGEILSQSLEDEPREGMVQTDVSIGGDGSLVHVFFGFVDSENYYVASWGYEGERTYVHQVEDGNVLTVYVRDAKRPEVFAYGDYVRIRVRFWWDGTDNFRVSWDYRDGETWTSLGDDVELPLREDVPGGGIGVGGQAEVAHWAVETPVNYSVSYDRTSIHYPQ